MDVVLSAIPHPQFGINFHKKNCNVPSVTLFSKELEILYFGTPSKPPDDRVLSGPELWLGFHTARYVDIDFD